MPRRTKFIIYLLLVGGLVAVSAVILTSKNDAPPAVKEAVAPVDQVMLENNYKEKAKAAMDEYAVLEASGDFSPEKIKKIKNDLLALTVPRDYKELHVELVLAFTKIESPEEGEANIQEGRQRIEKAIAGYSWF